ncbi:polysaccharide biosynthesis/export family protein [Pedobacter sp.]|uniref:polysaccharide biosynthesis/export family protein n=1 Tax=Pedobacter sp. TaxID=1411316 RepID=UPI002C4066B5|nr:polysaccharide biosynthesis/export family protein [Pedobacter sp.]HWW41774.1 polysaccharide biosynthesis/export family protein [Pedobacter sp.]
MIRKLPRICAFGGVLVFIALCFSCGSTKNAIYFSDLDSSRVKQIPATEFHEPLIQADDILSITVQTIDPSASLPVNQTGNPPSATASAVTGAVSGFLVDKNGYVELPMLGMIKVAGLNTMDAKEAVRAKAVKYYKNPTIQLRFANFKVTVLGEVAKPASYIVPNEKVSILDAISLAGDLTIYGKRQNIMLIRDYGTWKDVIRLDLGSSSLMASPYFYLKQNDVIYVEPNKAKVAANNAPKNQFITIILAVATLIVTAVRL